MSQKIKEFSCEGAWSVSHRFFYDSVYACRDDYEKYSEILENEIKNAGDAYNDEPEFKSGYIKHVIEIENDYNYDDACARSASLVLLFSCMTIEAFLNFYGVRRLGEAYYKKFVERLGVTQKLAYLFSIGRDEVLKTDEEVIRLCQQLFDKRNALVHPKSRELIKGSVNSKPIPSWDEKRINLKSSVDKYIQNLERVITIFCELDKNISQSFEFKVDKSS